MLYKPPGAEERQAARLAAAPAPPIPSAKAKAQAKKEKEAANKPQPMLYCKRFLTQTGCPKSAEDCDYAHLNEANVKVIFEKQKGAIVRAAAKAKAKAAAQG